MAVVDQSGIVGKIRDRPIGAQLEQLLKGAAEATGIDRVYVTSGSQPGSHGQSTGSTRHNNGRAADLQLIRNGATLTFTDQNGGSVAPFITACAARGASGIGAGVGYMGPRTIHVGYGTSANDHSRITWGADGASANAPQWLRIAAQAGWSNPVAAAAAGSNLAAAVPSQHPMPDDQGDFVVIARGGLQLRKGPGLDFGITKTVETGAEIKVLGFDGAGAAWARVDLEGDGLIDGHMFAAFLSPAEAMIPDEDVREPQSEG